MRRLITLHIGRGLGLCRPVLRVSAFLSWVSGVDCLSPAFIDLPISGRVPLQLEGLHPVDADALAQRLRARGLEHPSLATNDASTINAIAAACAEGELRIVSHAMGACRVWDIDEMMAFHSARAAGSAVSPAAMLVKLGLWV